MPVMSGRGRGWSVDDAMHEILDRGGQHAGIRRGGRAGECHRYRGDRSRQPGAAG
jgi:hypothetical protein